MKTSISYIADMFSGIYVNTAISRGKTVYYLQARHFDKQRKWTLHLEPELEQEKRFDRNYLETGDILLVTKGTEYFAALYDGRYAPAIASSVFTVLRIKDKTTILPAYLQWYLNHPVTGRKLAAASKGSSMQLITRDEIEGIEVPIPEIKKQEIILKAEGLQQQAMQIHSRINRLKETIFHYSLLQTANQS
jgi:restriction endonuclease S subunit